jgi:hypothetical protein
MAHPQIIFDKATPLATSASRLFDTGPPADLPLMIALDERRPGYRRFFIHGLNGVPPHLEVVAIPILAI